MIRIIASLFVDETRRTVIQLFRYTLVGGLAFAVDFGSLAILWQVLGLHYLWAAAFAFFFGLVTNYIISVAWVFDNRSQRSWQIEFAIFGLLGGFGLGINEISMFAITDWFGLNPLVSKIVSTSVTFAWNFISRKVLLFSIASKEPTKADATSAGVTPVVVDAPVLD